MKLMILAVGKPRERRLAELAGSYLERTHVEVGRVPDSDVEREGKDLLKRLQPRDRVILLSEDGEERDSPAFAALLASEMERAEGRLVFVVGGPWGVSGAVRERADRRLALSRMTFTHEMCLLFLAEQLYRAFSILQGTGYHH